MLQDPRPIKPLQHALSEVLEQLAIEFLPSQWRLQESLTDPGPQQELRHLQSYLDACNIPYQVFHNIQTQELRHLSAVTGPGKKNMNLAEAGATDQLR